MTRPPALRSTSSTARAASHWRAAATSTRCAAGCRGAARAASRERRARSGRSALDACSNGSPWRSPAGSCCPCSLFLLSAQTQDGVSPRPERALSSEGSLFTGSNILVLGSDARTGESIDESQSGPGRSDTIMLVHAAFGSVRKLSIPRDVEAEVPGHGINKINAAYAIGGPALTIETVEAFLGNGVKVNHLVEVDFKNFPDFIDSLGGVTVNNSRASAPRRSTTSGRACTSGRARSSSNGERALGFARIRKNPLRPGGERPRPRRPPAAGAERIGSKVKSPSTFFRLPWVSWKAPRRCASDMNGLQLMMLFADMATGTSDQTEVLEATCCRGGTCSSRTARRPTPPQACRAARRRTRTLDELFVGARVLLLRVGAETSELDDESESEDSDFDGRASDDEPSEDEPSPAAAPDFFLP